MKKKSILSATEKKQLLKDAKLLIKRGKAYELMGQVMQECGEAQIEFTKGNFLTAEEFAALDDVKK